MSDVNKLKRKIKQNPSNEVTNRVLNIKAENRYKNKSALTSKNGSISKAGEAILKFDR